MKLFDNFGMRIFGASHAPEIGVEIIGLPKGLAIDTEEVQEFVDRRRSRNGVAETARTEADTVIFESGIEDGKTDGQPVRAVIRNTNVRRGDYDAMKYIPRPSHADFPARIRFGDGFDLSGGGPFSGRLTAPLCIAGGIAKQLLGKRGVSVAAYVSEIGGVSLGSYADGVDTAAAKAAKDNPFGALREDNIKEAEALVMQKRAELDSVGGAVECIVEGAPVGLGGWLYDGLESKISAALFTVPAVKAVEFGMGTEFSRAFGSSANDGYYFDGDAVKTYTNNCGGIVGGMTTGMPVLMRATLKPTPSIAKVQKSVDLKTKRNVELEIKGRHDVCIVPRAVAPIEAAAALAVLDEMINYEKPVKTEA